MSCELIGPGKPPPAILPVADERLLAGVAPHVGFEVARLGVHLAASGERAGKDLVVVFDVGFGRRVFPV